MKTETIESRFSEAVNALIHLPSVQRFSGVFQFMGAMEVLMTPESFSRAAILKTLERIVRDNQAEAAKKVA